MKKRTKIFTVVLLSLFMIGAAGWGYLRSQSQTATPTALKVAKIAEAEDQALVFSSKQKNTPVVIFYPGALVQPESYSQWASKVAEAGFPVYIMRFPLDLAVLAPNRAAQVLDQTDRDYVIGGHSLGGVMASRFARTNSKRLQGGLLSSELSRSKRQVNSKSCPGLVVDGQSRRGLRLGSLPHG